MVNQTNPIKVNLNNIPNMKCYCTADVFSKVYNLKYISPILYGDPKGGSAVVFMYRCTLCGQIYSAATTADEVNKIYQRLPPERKAFVDEIKQKLKDRALSIGDGGLYTPPVEK